MKQYEYEWSGLKVFAFSWEEAFFLINAALINNAAGWKDDLFIVREDGKQCRVFTTGIQTQFGNH